MALEYVMGLVVGEFQKSLFNQLDKMPPDLIERIVKSYIAVSTEDVSGKDTIKKL